MTSPVSLPWESVSTKVSGLSRAACILIALGLREKGCVCVCVCVWVCVGVGVGGGGGVWGVGACGCVVWWCMCVWLCLLGGVCASERCCSCKELPLQTAADVKPDSCRPLCMGELLAEICHKPMHRQLFYGCVTHTLTRKHTHTHTLTLTHKHTHTL